MSFYDKFKDVLSIAQKADNIELYRQLLELSAQALDLQEENTRLHREIEELRNKANISQQIERHPETYITLKDDEQHLLYCAHCWDSEEKLVQLECNDGSFRCPHCKMNGYYNKSMAMAKIHSIGTSFPIL